MPVFPFYGIRIENCGRIQEFSRAIEPLDVMCRQLVASLLLQCDRGATSTVRKYYDEFWSGEITSSPVSGDDIRCYEVFRYIVELYVRSPDWAEAVTKWLDEFADKVGFPPSPPSSVSSINEDI